MFRNSKQRYTSVAIVTKKNDYLLNYRLGDSCLPIENYKKKKCPKSLKIKDKFGAEMAVVECVNNSKVPPVFQILNVLDSDKHINMVRNNIPVTKNVSDNYAALSEEFLKVRNFKNGIGEPSVIQARFGVLIDTLLKDMRKAWKEHEANNQTLKFKAYSTQDWLMSGVLDGFGVLHHIESQGPKEEPNYNVMILIELWKKANGEAYVKFLYKPEEVTKEDHVMMDLTEFVPGCEGMKECPRKIFDNCCNSTRATRKKQNELCFPDYDDDEDDHFDDEGDDDD